VTNSNKNIPADKELVQQVLDGNLHAYTRLIRHTERLVAQIVFKMISNPEDRKDIAQDIYLKIHRKLPSFSFQSKLTTWVAQVSYNTCLDYLRKKKLLLPGDGPEGNEAEDEGWFADKFFAGSPAVAVDTMIHKKEVAAILKTAISKLPPVYNTLISLYHQEEMSYEEIGQITGLPDGTVKNYLFRARKMLKNELLVTYKKDDL